MNLFFSFTYAGQSHPNTYISFAFVEVGDLFVKHLDLELSFLQFLVQSFVVRLPLLNKVSGDSYLTSLFSFYLSILWSMVSFSSLLFVRDISR